MDILNQMIARAKANPQRIVLPEGDEPRTLEAANILLKDKIAQLILIGDPEKIKSMAAEKGYEYIKEAKIVDPIHDPKMPEYANLLFELRKAKGMTEEEAAKKAQDPLYLGCLMIKAGDADGELAGARGTTADTIRPAFQILKTKPGCSIVEIAISTAETARAIAGIEPRVAMLSFSTKGSAKHELVDKVQEATKLAKEMAPDLALDGELQADAALVESVAKTKAPGSNVAGKANVLVFPDLQAGNIGYKLVERFSGADAVGPILQGIAAPVNDLSRGCKVQDIVQMVVITANQAIK